MLCAHTEPWWYFRGKCCASHIQWQLQLSFGLYMHQRDKHTPSNVARIVLLFSMAKSPGTSVLYQKSLY